MGDKIVAGALSPRFNKLKSAIFIGIILFVSAVMSLGARADSTPSSTVPNTGEKRRRHQLGFDIGSDADPDLLAPVVPVGLDRHFEWEYRFVVREDRLGVNVQYRDPARLQKLSFSFRQRMDFPTRVGLGRRRDKTYKSLNQKTPAKDAGGYVSGAALVLNHYWGISVTHDELLMTATNDHFHRQITVLGLGYSPLGENQGKTWSYSIDPYVSYERFHRLEPAPNGRYESFGYSLGPSFYYGLDWVRVGPKKWFRLDRLKVGAAMSESETADLTVTLSVNLTSYVTRHLKLSMGAVDSFRTTTGEREIRWKLGASLRLG